MAGQQRSARGRKPSKSAVTVRTEIRSLDVLEYLNHRGGEGRVSEIARALEFPQSSASRLLVQLSDAGYLTYDRRRRTYRASARAALLGAQTFTRVFGAGQPLRMMEELRRLSRAAVLLTSRQQTKLNIVHVEVPEETDEPCFHVGEASPLVNTASGKVMLSRFADSFIQALVRRYNAEIGRSQERVRPEAVLDDVAQVRQRGYLIQPVEAAVHAMGARCRGAGSAQCAVSCCLARRGPHLVAPIASAEGQEMAAIVGLPPSLEERHHTAFAAEAQAIINRYMPAA